MVLNLKISLKKISHWTPFTLKRYNLDEACVRLDLGEKRGIQIFRFLHMSIITSPFDLETFCWRPIHTLYLKVYVPYRYSMSQIGKEYGPDKWWTDEGETVEPHDIVEPQV